VLRNLQTVAESTQCLSVAVKAKRPEIEWRRIAVFRILLVHDYLGIDMETIWDVGTEAGSPGRVLVSMRDPFDLKH
jgi:uncharacterized protein with HEPN domain